MSKLYIGVKLVMVIIAMAMSIMADTVFRRERNITLAKWLPFDETLPIEQQNLLIQLGSLYLRVG